MLYNWNHLSFFTQFHFLEVQPDCCILVLFICITFFCPSPAPYKLLPFPNLLPIYFQVFFCYWWPSYSKYSYLLEHGWGIIYRNISNLRVATEENASPPSHLWEEGGLMGLNSLHDTMFQDPVLGRYCGNKNSYCQLTSATARHWDSVQISHFRLLKYISVFITEYFPMVWIYCILFNH